MVVDSKVLPGCLIVQSVRRSISDFSQEDLLTDLGFESFTSSWFAGARVCLTSLASNLTALVAAPVVAGLELGSFDILYCLISLP